MKCLESGRKKNMNKEKIDKAQQDKFAVDPKESEFKLAEKTLKKNIENLIPFIEGLNDPALKVFFARVACSLSRTEDPMSNADRAKLASVYNHFIKK